MWASKDCEQTTLCVHTYVCYKRRQELLLGTGELCVTLYVELGLMASALITE